MPALQRQQYGLEAAPSPRPVPTHHIGKSVKSIFDFFIRSLRMQGSPKGTVGGCVCVWCGNALVSTAAAQASSWLPPCPSFQRRCGKSGHLPSCHADVWGRTGNDNAEGCTPQDGDGGLKKLEDGKQTDLCVGGAGACCCCTVRDTPALASSRGRASFGSSGRAGKHP